MTIKEYNELLEYINRNYQQYNIKINSKFNMSLGNIECSDIYFSITTQLGTSTSIGFRENKCTVDNNKDYFNRNIPKDCYISGNDVYRIKRIKSVRDSN